MIVNRCPINYAALCHHTVTVYHKDGETITRKVISGVHLEYKTTYSVDKNGTRTANTFLLIVPGAAQAVFPGDKILPGQGAEIVTRAEWANLLPAKVQGLVVASAVDPKYWLGNVVHYEVTG